MRKYEVATARVQTFQTGTVSQGTVVLAGVSRSIGAYWGAFGGMGKINQNSINQFRTDIQLKLVDHSSNERTFVSASIPFELTLSIDPGDALTLYFAKGGLAQPAVAGDFNLTEWKPFVALNASNDQLIPLGAIPSLEEPRFAGGGVVAFFLCVAAFLFLVALAASSETAAVFGLISAGLGGLLIMTGLMPKKRWKENLAAAQQLATGTAL